MIKRTRSGAVATAPPIANPPRRGPRWEARNEWGESVAWTFAAPDPVAAAELAAAYLAERDLVEHGLTTIDVRLPHTNWFRVPVTIEGDDEDVEIVGGKVELLSR